MEGTISLIGGLFRVYHSGEEAVPGITARQTVSSRFANHLLVLLGLQGTGGIHQDAAGREHRECVPEQRLLPDLQIGEILGSQLPFDLRIAPERPCAGAWR